MSKPTYPTGSRHLTCAERPVEVGDIVGRAPIGRGTWLYRAWQVGSSHADFEPVNEKGDIRRRNGFIMPGFYDSRRMPGHEYYSRADGGAVMVEVEGN